MHKPSSSIQPAPDTPGNHQALDQPLKPDARSRTLFILAALLFLAWVAFLAVLAIISGKRPETRSKEGNRAAFRPIHFQPGSGQSRTMGYSATASAPADTATG